VDRARSKHGRGEEYIQAFDGKSRSEEAAREA
jgi:hypothetical protein